MASPRFRKPILPRDLKKITVPVFVMHGDDDQIVPYAELCTIVGKVAEERDAEDLQGLSTRHADHKCGNDQHRPAGFPEGITL